MGDTIPYQAGYTVWTQREPHGVTGHVIPWNYPMQIVGRSVAAALAAGNAEEWGRLNAEFHLALYAKADLPRTLATVIGLLQTSERYTRLQLSDAARLERAMAEHRALVRLCRRGVADEAVKLLGDHVEAVRHDLLALAVP